MLRRGPEQSPGRERLPAFPFAGPAEEASRPAPHLTRFAEARGRNRVTGNHSARSRPLAPPQHLPRIAIARDFPRGAASRYRTLYRSGLCKPLSYRYDRLLAAQSSGLIERAWALL